jgi:hypothetical protein
MSVNAINPGSNADLVSAISESVGQGSVPVDASVGVLKKALNIAQSTEQQLISEVARVGTNLNVFA